MLEAYLLPPWGRSRDVGPGELAQATRRREGTGLEKRAGPLPRISMFSVAWPNTATGLRIHVIGLAPINNAPLATYDEGYIHNVK